MDIQISVDDSKAKKFIAFLKELDFVVVRPLFKEASPKARKTPKFSYFGSCPDWDVDAQELRQSGNRDKAQW
jgi:hypothetical protein